MSNIENTTKIDRIKTVLTLLKKDDEILLAKKKRGFGIGKYNGVGGKIEKNETSKEAMIRETYEEIKVTPIEFEKVGKIEFNEYYKGKKQKIIMDIYIAYKWIGTPEESEEMNPTWFSIKNIPYDKMFPDDKYWLPLILEHKKIDAYFEFDEKWNLLYKEIKII